MNNRFFNWLMYYNRSSTLPKLEKLMKTLPSLRYADYVELVEHKMAWTSATAELC